jgi:hypothetical protein
MTTSSPTAPRRTLTNRIGMQQNGWQPHGKLLASAKVVLDLNGARQRSEDGGSTSCVDNLSAFLGVFFSTEIASCRR